MQLSLKLGDVAQASQIMDVPLKNLKRWVQNGPRRKKGGRKTHDPQMETKLCEWVRNFREIYDELPARKHIKETAIKFSQFPQKFKASKGWYEKFMLRHFKSEKSASREADDAQDNQGNTRVKCKTKQVTENNKETKKDEENRISDVTVRDHLIHQRIAGLWDFVQSNDDRQKITAKVDSFIEMVVGFSDQTRPKSEIAVHPHPILQRKFPANSDEPFEQQNNAQMDENNQIRRESRDDDSGNSLKKQFLPMMTSLKSENFLNQAELPQDNLKLGQGASFHSREPHSIFVRNSTQKHVFDSDKHHTHTESSHRKFGPHSYSGRSDSFKLKSEHRPHSGDSRLRPGGLLVQNASHEDGGTQTTRKMRGCPGDTLGEFNGGREPRIRTVHTGSPNVSRNGENLEGREKEFLRWRVEAG